MNAVIISIIMLLALSTTADASQWNKKPGAAKDIGIGANGSIWVIGTDTSSGGYGIHKWSGSKWNRVSGGAVRIDVDPTGRPWVVNSVNHIYRWEGKKWQRMPGSAKDIGIGADGSVWVIGTDKRSGGYGIHKWNGSRWNRVRGGAVRIDVDARGIPWVVNSVGKIYKWGGTRWNQLRGSARDIGIGGNQVWTIGRKSASGGYQIQKWRKSQRDWFTVSGGAVNISADRNGKPWVVNSLGRIFEKKRLRGNSTTDALSEAQINNMAESKEWVIGANPDARGYLYTKRKWVGDKNYNYNLKGLVPRKFFHYEKQGYFGGINLGWTNNASAKTGRERARWYFTRSSNSKGPIKYGESLAIAWHTSGYIRYASRKSGINLDWSKKPHYQWKILGGKNGTAIKRGKDKVIIYNTRHKNPLIYYKRKGAGHIGWPDSTDWSVRGQVRDSAIVTKNIVADTVTKPIRPLVGKAEIDTYIRLKRGQRNCKKQRDSCTNCYPPRRNDDKDRDGIPDLLEYDLAHKFYPNVMVYGDKYDLQQAYLKNGYATPFIVKKIGGGQCGNETEKKCLEIRLGITFIMDAGDDALGGTGSHIGDSEMYTAVVKRNGSWAQAKNNANGWQIIRDFTSAHWGTLGEASKMKAYPEGRRERVTIHSATRKHALYHSGSACDKGVLWIDDCPGKGKNLIRYKKRNSLQNIGSRNNNVGMDTTIADPVCGVYHVWGDRSFGEDGAFSNYIEKKISYKLRKSPNRPAARPAPSSSASANKESSCFNMVQGKVAWRQGGSKKWGPNNFKRLCKSTRNPRATVNCFKRGIASHNSWQRALETCRVK